MAGFEREWDEENPVFWLANHAGQMSLRAVTKVSSCRVYAITQQGMEEQIGSHFGSIFLLLFIATPAPPPPQLLGTALGLSCPSPLLRLPIVFLQSTF